MRSSSSSSSVWPENLSQYQSTTSSSSAMNLQPPPPAEPSHSSNSKNCRCNIFRLLVRREVSPKNKHCPKKFWGETARCHLDSHGLKSDAAIDPRRGLISWVEAESLQHLSSRYCPLLPPPRSTIAATFSSDGNNLASTHGDHTVKIIDSQTSNCLKVLSGHRRTPWVVRFHPLYPELLASGSLDHEVRLWNATSAECIGSRDFYRPIASIAFHAQGEFLAVASGHKLYIWHYNKRGEASSPTIILKTRRSLRAVHFHPYAAPLLLTAEVNDLDSSDSSMTVATSAGYLHYPPPTMYLADGHSSSRFSQPNEPFLSPMQSDGSLMQEEQQTSSVGRETEDAVSRPLVDAMDTDAPPEERRNNFFPFSDPAFWDLPFLQGWLIGQSQANIRALHPQNGGAIESLLPGDIDNPSSISASVSHNATNTRITGRTGLRQQPSRVRVPSAGFGNGSAFSSILHNDNNPQPVMSQVQPELSTSLAAAAASELPCTVKLRLWSHDLKDPCSPLDAERCCLTIPHAVLCSEMGAHFSPCGRFLAACVACVLPNTEADPGFSGQVHHDAAEVATSPTRHPISAHKVMYELRVYSLEESTFGLVLASRAIRAAHCLTSIQFSPTSEHLLLAYGRRHSSLLISVVIDGEMMVPVYTILEVYRVSDMELVRVIPSAEDEVNVACFHPSVGCGLVYGTKEGKLRFLQYNTSPMA